MERIRLTPEEFIEFRDVQIRPRADWPATFSRNYMGDVWPWSPYSPTREQDRRYLQGQIPLLDEVVAIVLRKRSEGGRFFLDEDGVHIEPEGFERQQIVCFEIS